MQDTMDEKKEVAAEEETAVSETEATDKEVETEEETATDTEAKEATDVPIKFWKGQEIVSDGTREVEGKTYHHVKLADGTTSDLTEAEYSAL